MHVVTRSAALLLCSLLPLVEVSAQNIDTVGGTTVSAARTSTSKASKYRIDTTSLLLEYEMYLDVPGVDTLTFFAYQLHSEAGTAGLAWTHSVPVDGTGVGPAWYSTGPISLPLVCSNYYMIGVAWSGSLTYYYDRGVSGDPVSFGAWMSGATPGSPPPATRNFTAGVDVAKYYQRLTTLPSGAVVNCIGTGCRPAGGALPRLVADSIATRGASIDLFTTDASPSVPVGYVFTLGTNTLPAPVSVLGCSIWLDFSLGSIGGSATSSVGGLATVSLTIPNDPQLGGIPFSVQNAIVEPGGVSFTNALDFIIN